MPSNYYHIIIIIIDLFHIPTIPKMYTHIIHIFVHMIATFRKLTQLDFPNAPYEIYQTWQVRMKYIVWFNYCRDISVR